MSVPAALRSDRGELVPMRTDRWLSPPSPGDLDLLQRARSPVLDVGCGPGRHTIALLRRGVSALGVDSSASAVRIARSRGAPVVHRSVFDPLPREGSWRTALLLDGNIGIGGDPLSLLRRLGDALARQAMILVEVEPSGRSTERLRVRVEGSRGSWFPWARVGADDLAAIAQVGGFRLAELWATEGRWFGRLDR